MKNNSPVITYLSHGRNIEIGRIAALDFLKVQLPIANLPDKLHGFRILHLSDMHIDRLWMPAWDTVIEYSTNDPPDVICISGDFVEHKADHRHAIPFVRKFVDSLQTKCGIYGILGNHDGDILPLHVRGWNAQLLDHELVRLADGDCAVEIVGINGTNRDDWQASQSTLFGVKQAGTIRIVLTHYPSQIYELEGISPDIILTGHTHGGQICLPGGYPIFTHDYLPKDQSSGIHHINNIWLIISKGLGYSGYNLRTFCPAEAMEITLVPDTSHANTSE